MQVGHQFEQASVLIGQDVAALVGQQRLAQLSFRAQQVVPGVRLRLLPSLGKLLYRTLGRRRFDQISTTRSTKTPQR
jgi:hypothetical protein